MMFKFRRRRKTFLRAVLCILLFFFVVQYVRELFADTISDRWSRPAAGAFFGRFIGRDFRVDGEGTQHSGALAYIGEPETRSETEKPRPEVCEWSVEDLLTSMGERWHWTWIKDRIRRTWHELDSAARLLRGGQNCSAWTGQRRKLMILPGVLSLTNFARPEAIRRGGPLGELMQWADLIAGCFSLCHSLALRIHITGTIYELRVEADDFKAGHVTSLNGTGCDVDYVDVLFTDIAAVHKFPPDVLDSYRNRLRILDAFGTEPMYNDPVYAKRHPELDGKTAWGKLGFHPKQFYTLYPHTPDNSFLGFVVADFSCNSSIVKSNFSLVLGKEFNYLRKNIKALEIIHKYAPLRLTTRPGPAVLPSDTYFYGVVDSVTYRSILREAKICIGLGDPIESPSVLEALANGCIFLNPKRPEDSSTFPDKPTGRKITSQNPYLEKNIGPPYVYTVDYEDTDALKRVLEEITSPTATVEPFVPYEFTALGYLERLDAYLVHQDLCNRSGGGNRSLTPLVRSSSAIWPPLSALQVLLSEPGSSCSETCEKRGLVCEPEYFPVMNNASYIQRISGLSIRCDFVRYVDEPYVPALLAELEPKSGEKVTCQLQSRSMLFSCAEGHPDSGVRICPCRDFMRHQTALCRTCGHPNLLKQQRKTECSRTEPT